MIVIQLGLTQIHASNLLGLQVFLDCLLVIVEQDGRRWIEITTSIRATVRRCILEHPFGIKLVGAVQLMVAARTTVATIATVHTGLGLPPVGRHPNLIPRRKAQVVVGYIFDRWGQVIRRETDKVRDRPKLLFPKVRVAVIAAYMAPHPRPPKIALPTRTWVAPKAIAVS